MITLKQLYSVNDMKLINKPIMHISAAVAMGGNLGIRMGPNTFDDLDYADDGALLPPDRAITSALLERFDEEAGHLGLHV